MADPDKVPDSQTDTPMESETVQSPKLSESQDFRLIDEETEKDPQDETQVTARIASEQNEETPVQKEDITRSGPEGNDKKAQSDAENDNRDDDDDDDFVPSSQQEIESPLKKQITGLIGVISQKRKAETSEEPRAKFPRTCSEEGDAALCVRKKSSDEEDLFDAESADESSEAAAVLTSKETIAETQESSPTEVKSESLRQVEKELEEALSRHEVNDECSKTDGKDQTEKSSPVEENSPIERKKSLTTEVLEEKMENTPIERTKPSMTEVLDEKMENSPIERTKPSMTEVLDEEMKNSPIERTKPSMTEVLDEEMENSPIERTKPSMTEVLDEEMENSPIERTKPSMTEVLDEKMENSPIERTKPSMTEVLDEKMVNSPIERTKPLMTEVLDEKMENSPIERMKPSMTEVLDEEMKNSPIERKKPSITEAFEEKTVASMTEATQDKKTEESSDVRASSLTEAIEDKRSRTNGDTTEEPESTTVEVPEEKKKSVSDEEKKCSPEVVAERESSLELQGEEASSMEVEEAKKSPEDEKDETAEESKSEGEAEKSADPSGSSKEPEKVDSTPPATTAKDDETESTNRSPTVGTKDEESEAMPAVAADPTPSDTTGCRTREICIEAQTEMAAPVAVPSNKSRMSIEVIYDRATAPPEKKRPRELVEIDEDGEKIVLDSSQEGSGGGGAVCGDESTEKSAIENKVETSYKSCVESRASGTDYRSIDTGKESSNDSRAGYSLTNGSAETKKTDLDETASAGSDLLSDDRVRTIEAVAPSKKAQTAPPIISISDSEGDSFVADEKPRNKFEPASRENPTIKVVEKELSILVKMKCSVHIDESTKEHVDKVITWVHSESSAQDLSSTRRRNSDASASLADISGNAGGNKDASPGSVTSLAQPYALDSRLSLASTVSTSSASSAASMHAKLSGNAQFQLPRVPVKHAKKATSEISTADGKQESNIEGFEQIGREWKHAGLLLASFFNCAREELGSSDLHNGSTERVDNSMAAIRSSTPELERRDGAAKSPPPPPRDPATPKSTTERSGRSTKRSRSKTVRSVGSKDPTKTSPSLGTKVEAAPATPSSGVKRKSSPETPSSRQSANSKASSNDTDDHRLVGKEVFAKWSDNKYYPGSVVGRTKTKFRVNFYDGQHKLIIEDFIVPMPTMLRVGLSVYATSSDDDYGSCGIIVDAKKVKDNVIYTVQTDEQEEIRVRIKNIFLTNDQVQVLREETEVDPKTPPSTPKLLGKVSLDNVVDGKRRSKRITTPLVSTPKAKRARGSLADVSKPSTSGVSFRAKPDENHDTTSDSNYSALEEPELLGVQPELSGTPNEQEESKGPASRLKGKARGRKRAEDPDVVAKLGPIPAADSKIFNGMSFLLTCASLDTIDRFQNDTRDSNSDPGTENEEEWTRKPFVRDRLMAQLTAGGGKLYESFELIPPEEYDSTKLITNVPNLTKKSLLCLSVGIKAYNHQWIIRCCKENKIVNPSEEELPAGWSLMKQSYVEMFQRRNKKPFQTLPVIVVIPLIPGEEDFVTYWTQICQNAGGAVLLPENPYDSFIEGTVVLTNKRCPSWVIEKAKSWSIPIVSTTWVIQSLIEGNICTYDAHPSFDYNYVKRPPSRISNLKRLE